MTLVGISGFAAYLPPYRTSIEDWCKWTDESWDKLRDSVGNSFRVRGHHQNVYTMAANAVIRLIQQYDVDPRSIGFLAFGTESSTDNSAGAVIIKGMVDQGLKALGLPTLSSNSEVPEYKHACLGGVYAMKAALRYLAYDGHNARAIVVSADSAEYARGSTGEPTQGAGAVAMLMERDPKLLAIDLEKSGNSSDYRGPDFRKPFVRFAQQKATCNNHLRDFPIFNGYYSTNCYIDAMLIALNHMLSKRGTARADYLRNVCAVFMHRPYSRMPQTGWAMSYLFALALGNEEDHDELREYCDAARVKFHDVVDELTAVRDLYECVENTKLKSPFFSRSMRVVRVLKRFDKYCELEKKMSLGWETMTEVGNLYTASLPAWLAAGLEHAYKSDAALLNQDILAIGYGSGDAAEAIPMRAVPGWKKYARKICFSETFENAIDLSKQQYEALHDGQPVDLPVDTEGEFFISRIGKDDKHDFDEAGIEYYDYNPAITPAPSNNDDSVKAITRIATHSKS